MPNAKVQLRLTVEGFDAIDGSLEQSIASGATIVGMNYFIQEGLSALKSELLYGDYLEALPTAEGLSPALTDKPRTYSLQDATNGAIENETNKQELWRFIGNNAHAIRIWLAKAQALQTIQDSTDPNDSRLRNILQFEKLDKLHLAVHAIANLRDLHKRIFSEALGGIPLDVTSLKGQKHPARSLEDVLKHRSQFPQVMNLDANDVAVLEKVANELRTAATPTTKAFLKYRNCLVHQEPQIVDDPRFYPQLEDRKWSTITRDGKIVGKKKSMFRHRRNIDWIFDELFKVVVGAFKQYLDTLQMLRSLDTFGPDRARIVEQCPS